MRILFILTAFIPCTVLAQPDSLNSSTQPIDFTAEIFNGKEHSGYVPGITGTAYYMENDWQPGSVTYREINYPSMWLKYDLVQKELIVRHPANKVAITLFTPRVSSFSVLGKNFVKIAEGDNSCLKPGIYEEVQKGKLNFYILRSKYLLETTTPYGMERQFLVNDSYYVLKDGTCHIIKKKKNILNLVSEKKSAIKADLRRKALSFKREREAALVEIITYYNNAVN